MKFVGKLLLTLLLIFLLLLVTAYVLLQTQWGAGWIGRTLSSDNGWQISLRKMEHNFSSPSHLIFNDVRFGHAGQPPLLAAQNVDLGLQWLQFSQPLHFASITLEKGTLNIAQPTRAIPLAAERLQLRDMAINGPGWTLPVAAQRVNGGVVPWQPQPDNLLGQQANFQLSAGALTLNDVPGENVLIQGRFTNNALVFSNVGADVARGSLTGNAERDAEGNWHIGNLRLNSLRLQTASSLNDFLRPLTTLPSVRFDRLDITDARMQGPDWAVTDLDLSLKDLTLSKGDWQSDDGNLSMNANSFINGPLELHDPIASLDFSPQGIKVTQFSSRFANGLIRSQGEWSRANQRLTLNELVVAGLEYTLPGDWRSRWQAELPDWLESVVVNKFTANRNLIIDINPDWPFQMTSLDGSASNLMLARRHQWGIWQGELSFNAAEATFNRVDVRHPSITLQADDQQIGIRELSAFTGNGILEATGSISQQPQRTAEVRLTGKAVPANTLHAWGWPTLTLNGDANMQLQVTGQLAADSALLPTVNGALSVTTEQSSIQQRMRGGALVSSPASREEGISE